MAASAASALKAGVWFRRGRLLIVSPDSLGTACPLSGRNSTYRPVQISGTGSISLFGPVLRRVYNAKLVDVGEVLGLSVGNGESGRGASFENLTQIHHGLDLVQTQSREK